MPVTHFPPLLSLASVSLSSLSISFQLRLHSSVTRLSGDLRAEGRLRVLESDLSGSRRDGDVGKMGKGNGAGA